MIVHYLQLANYLVPDPNFHIIRWKNSWFQQTVRHGQFLKIFSGNSLKTVTICLSRALGKNIFIAGLRQGPTEWELLYLAALQLPRTENQHDFSTLSFLSTLLNGQKPPKKKNIYPGKSQQSSSHHHYTHWGQIMRQFCLLCSSDISNEQQEREENHHKESDADYPGWRLVASLLRIMIDFFFPQAYLSCCSFLPEICFRHLPRTQ